MTLYIARALSVSLWACVVGFSQPASSADCKSESEASAARASVEADLRSIKAAQARSEAEIQRELDAKSSALGWTPEQKSKIFVAVLASPAFSALEKEKQPYAAELVRIVGTLAKSEKEDPNIACSVGVRIGEIARLIQGLNERQYALMLQAVRTAQ